MTPTYTGLGERAHLANPSIDLETHIQDILNVIKYEDLRDIVLDDCQVFTTTEHRRAVIYAMKPSRITIAPLSSAPAATRSRRLTTGLVLQMQPA